MRFFVLICLCFWVAGCAVETDTPQAQRLPITGTAIIKDTFRKTAWNKANFFYVSQIDNKPVQNSFDLTRAKKDRQSLEIRPVPYERRIVAREITVTIWGKTEYGSPNAGSAMNRIAGNITFTPAANQTYFIKGELSARYSAVWIEAANGQVVAKKIEIGQRS